MVLEKIEWPCISDEKEVLERCPVCGEATKISFVVSLGNSRRPMVQKTACRCAQTEHDAAQQANKLQQFEVRLAQKWEASSFAMTTFRRNRFDADDGGNSSVSAACRKYVVRWNEMRAENLGVLFYGSVGTGKTFLAHAIANALISQGVSVCVTSIPRILNALQGCKDRQRALDELDSYSLLVIDDLGSERSSEYSREVVYSVIDQRGQAGLPLIVTSNLSIDEMKNPQDMQLQRIYDRVLDLCPIQFRLDGASRRTKNSEARRQRARDLLL